MVDEIEGLRCATIHVPAKTPEQAHETAREAVAVLRFFQRARYPRLSLDDQTFGLRGDLDTWVMPYYVRARPGPYIGGWSRGGVMADWTFSRQDKAAYKQDPVFTFLDNALRKAQLDRTDFERRALRALSVRHLAIGSRPTALRVPFVAVTLEALLGDKRSRDKAHRIAQRVAFVDCRGECGRGNPACFYIRAKDRDALEEQITLARASGSHGLCSEYWRIREVFDARVEALHEARTDFEKGIANDMQFWTDRNILAVIAWVVSNGARGLPDLRHAMTAAVSHAGGTIVAAGSP